MQLVQDSPGGSYCKESTCNVGDLGLITVLGRSPGRGHGNTLQYSWLENRHGQRSLVGCSPWRLKESDRTEQLNTAQQLVLRATEKETQKLGVFKGQEEGPYAWSLSDKGWKGKRKKQIELYKPPQSILIFFVCLISLNWKTVSRKGTDFSQWFYNLSQAVL